MNQKLLGILTVLLFLLTGCLHRHHEKQAEVYRESSSAHGYLDSSYDESVEMYFEEAPVAVPQGNYMMGAAGSVAGEGGLGTKGVGEGGGGSGDGYGSTAAEARSDTLDAQTQRPQSVHYNGHAYLRVSRVDEVADELSLLAQQVGGHVEELNPSRVTIRVPVETFRDVFAKVLQMGDVLGKSISATDISESLTSVSLRLKTAQATRDRLVKLLAKAEDETEKLELIRQIQRLTEEIDRLSGQSNTLQSLAAMSRITIELVPREALSRLDHGTDIAELSWIRQLGPFHTFVGSMGDRLALDTPTGFVELDPKGQFVLESADGARLWTGRLDNQPRGDTGFWLSAIQERLADEFGSAEVLQVGSYGMLRLVDREDDPYTYVIGIRADGKYLDLVEIYYPSSAHEERHGEAIESIIGGGAS
ncbi:MAG: DUF4349 domain-containing protein [Myxococcota bacterium]|jgi:hypothetical protein|nr:DUF4349 domain-containing protein [Myxococcota bacterium]